MIKTLSKVKTGRRFFELKVSIYIKPNLNTAGKSPCHASKNRSESVGAHHYHF